MRYLPSVLLIGGLAASLSAGSILIQNPSFESYVLGCSPGPTCATNDSTSGMAVANASLVGWTASTADPLGYSDPQVQGSGVYGLFSPGTAQFPAGVPDGVNAAYIQTWVYNESLSQVLTTNLQANDTYTLTAYAGYRLDNAGNFGCNGVNISLEAGGNVLNSAVAQGTSICNDTPQGTFVQFTVSYTSGVNPVGLGAPLEIVLEENGSGSIFEPGQIEFDQVALSDTLGSGSGVPEPGTVAMVGSALLVLGFWSRKRAVS